MEVEERLDRGKREQETSSENALIRLSIACNFCSRSIATLPKLKSKASVSQIDKKAVSPSVKEDVMRREKGSSSSGTDPNTSITSIESVPRRPVDVPCRCRKPRARCSLCLSRLNTPSTHNLFQGKSELEAFGVIKMSSYDTSLSTVTSVPVIVRNPFASFTVFCATCRHSGHASHYLDWFRTNNHCPVSGCTCQCSSLDKMEARGFEARHQWNEQKSTFIERCSPCDFGLLNSTMSTASPRNSSVTRNNAAESSTVKAQPNGHLKSCIALAVICEKHQTIGLRPIPNKAANWFPFFGIKDEDHWQSTAESFAERLLGSKVPVKFTSAYHSQVSRKGVWLKRVIFTAILKNPSAACCSNIKTLSWFPLNEVIGNIDDMRIWGSEPSFYAYTYVKKLGILQFLESNLKESIELYPSRNSSSPHHQIIFKSGMSMDDAVILAEEFYSHVYPSQNMNLPSFMEYFGLIGWSNDRNTLARIYNSFRTYTQDQVRLTAFITGIAAYSSSVPQAGITGAARNLYIFRYFDENRSGYLELNEFYNMRREIMTINKQAAGNPVELVVNELAYDYDAVRLPFGAAVGFDNFKGAISEMKLRGTSGLCRTRVPVRGVRLYHSDQVMAQAGDTTISRCKRHSRGTFAIEAYEVILDSSGHLSGTSPVPGNVLSNLTVAQKMSSDLLLSNTTPRRCITMVHDHAQAMGFFGKVQGVKHDWERLPDEKFNERVAIIQDILKRAKEIFLKEPPVKKVNSPVYVLGDIHGNLLDLMTFERVLWGKGACESGNFLFLGDYVDRGLDSMECILYLFAMKIANNSKFSLLRGNHEVRSLQISMTFKKEVLKKLSRGGKRHDFAKQMWHSFNDVFDSMPVCAVIDDSIFCAHGGIPGISATKLEHLMAIPKNMPDPENQSAPAWEMLWNDPMEKNDALAAINITSSGSKHSHLEQMKGFLKNEKRGTAYLYTDIAVNNFLGGNGLTHIIRAHEVIPPGYRYQMGGKVTTVFSTSRYCNQDNKAACIFVQDGKMRVIRIDT